MSIVTPVPQHTDIVLYGNVGWDNTYQNIRLFESKEEREEYLAPLQVDDGQFDTCSVVSGNKIRVIGRVNDFIEVTYLKFTNYGISNAGRAPTYYAFVTSVDYVNVNATELTFEIDWVQTYLFSFEFEACLVEREHVNNDTQGLWVLPENLDVGEYIIRKTDETNFTPVVLIYAWEEDIKSSAVNNVITTSAATGFYLSEIGEINTLLDRYNDAPERIQMIIMGVSDMLDFSDIRRVPKSFARFWSITREGNFSNDGGTTVYVPRNQKLRCYPYMFISLDNYMGNVENYRWEEFQTPSIAEFGIEGSACPKPAMICYPIDYKGVKATSTSRNTADQLSLEYTNFPMVPFTSNTFESWVSQYGTSNFISAGAQIATGVAGIAGSIATGNPILGFMGATSLASQIAGTVQDYRYHQIHGLQSHGNVGNAGLQFARGLIGFRATQYQIRREVAERLDKFFDRFGYKVDVVKVPNTKGRKNVNYVKTVGAQVKGNVPDVARRTLEQAMDRGVSFWHTNAIGADMASNPIVR